MLQAPSRSEYSEWTCRWTASGVDIGPTSIGAAADGTGPYAARCGLSRYTLTHGQAGADSGLRALADRVRRGRGAHRSASPARLRLGSREGGLDRAGRARDLPCRDHDLEAVADQPGAAVDAHRLRLRDRGGADRVAVPVLVQRRVDPDGGVPGRRRVVAADVDRDALQGGGASPARDAEARAAGAPAGRQAAPRGRCV